MPEDQRQPGERWQRAEQLYHEAAARPRDARARFLARACAGDEALRREVESLLAAASGRGMLDREPVDATAPPADGVSWPTLAGQQMGAYRLDSLIAAGGMGEVYRARDTRLDRDVAVKVLPARFTSDPDRLARFEREARVLARCNHPNIAAIYDVEEHGSTTALVMELVEGETLRERLERCWTSRAAGLDIGESLAIARQIADALDAAHELGIVHRDLKPDNIKITPAGVVKLLDFGLARAPSSSVDRHGPLRRDQTAHGLIIGTPAYMSPEQARGLAVDKRTDIWAFGCVLFEILSGRQYVASAIGSGVNGDSAGLAALPPMTSPAVRRVLRRCLEPDVTIRLRDIADARADIDDALSPAETAAAPSREWRGISARWRLPIAGVASAVVAGVAVSLLIRPAAAPSPPLSRTAVALPAGVPLVSTVWKDVAISADGSRVAYSSKGGLAVRSRDRLDSVLVRGPSISNFPFFSPDGLWIGYTDGRSLRKVPVAGGPSVLVAATGAAVVGNWGPDGIVFADVDGLFRISNDGGRPEKLLTSPDAGEQVTFPEMLPGGTAVLFTVMATRTSAISMERMLDAAGARIETLDLRSGARKVLVRGGGAARYVPSGHIVYASEGTLNAVAFDLDRLEVRGAPVRVADDSADFAVSSEGTLAYVSGALGAERSTLVWVNRQGREESVGAPVKPYVYPRLSPDGSRIALIIADRSTGERDVWVFDRQRRSLDRFSAPDPSDNPMLAWSLDGQWLVFGSARFGGIVNVFRQAADGRGVAERLISSPRVQVPLGFAPDGRLLISAEVPGHGQDIVALSMDGERRLEPVVAGPAADMTAAVSPDGRWIAYDSNESGQLDVYVRPYPRTADGRTVISTAGGRQPLWSLDGRELFYRDYSGAVMAVPMRFAPALAAGAAVKLVDGAGFAGDGSNGSARTYDIARDGRLLMIKKAETAPPQLVVVLNWGDELKRLAPSK